MKSQILITGATGKTSQYAIQELLNKGANVRAMVRTIDERSKALEKQGVEVVQGNYFNKGSLRMALHQIDKAYFCYPFEDHLPKAAAYFGKIAKEEGVKQVVSMSQMNVHEDSSSPASQNHLISEDILDWADIGAVHIRPALFAWNYLGMAAPSVSAEKKFYFPNPQARFTIIDPQDIGEVIAGILLDEDINKHTGKKYALTGSQILSNQDVTDLIGNVIQEKVEYVPIPVDTWIDALKGLPTVNNFLATHLKEFSKDIASGKFNSLTDNVKTITGHEPRSFEDYVKTNVGLFKQAS